MFMSALAAWRLFYMEPSPDWYAFVIIVLSFGLSILFGMSTGMAGATISLPIIAAVGFIVGKLAFTDNVVFKRRM